MQLSETVVGGYPHFSFRFLVQSLACHAEGIYSKGGCPINALRSATECRELMVSAAKARPDIGRGVAAFTLLETLVSVTLLAVLMGMLLPGLGRARDQAKLTSCSTSMASIGKAMFIFAGDNKGRFPINVEPWNSGRYRGGGFGYALDELSRAEYNGVAWIWRIHGTLGRTKRPWLAGLRCPTVPLDEPVAGAQAGEDRPGSCWLLNSYCSGRLISSIPRPADGVLVHESGLWEAVSSDTPLLEFPSNPWRYPHPAAGRFAATDRWDWLSRRGITPRRNILWADGHVGVSLAREWPNGDGSHDADRIRHMRFGLPEPWVPGS